MTAAFALLALLPSEIRYHISLDAAKDRLNVEMAFEPKAGQTVLQMPSWSPGLYVREEYWRTLDDVSATDETGRALGVTHTRGDSWALSVGGAKTVTVRYSRPVDRTTARLGMFASAGPAIHFTGPSTYLYVVGRTQEPCSVAFDAKRVATGLVKQGDRYPAKTYDELADATVTFGEFTESTYKVRGKDHVLALRGDTLDVGRATRIARFVSTAETDFFGGAPYERYVWHVMVAPMGDNAGGVEHLNGTDIFLGSTPGPNALRGMAHEFFHLWNVKRIRSRELGPFDYTTLPRSGALWWLEGVTDYYASLLPFRYGAWEADRFLGDATGAIRRVRSNAARLAVSPFESGDRTPESTSNSSGYRVDYYPTGWLLGLMFDVELRFRTNGKRSLDDVELALWRLCRDGKPGFGPDEIRKQLVKAGGDEMGDLYDAWVTKPGELPVEATISKLGLILREGRVALDPSANETGRRLRDAWLRQRPLPEASGLFPG